MPDDKAPLVEQAVSYARGYSAPEKQQGRASHIYREITGGGRIGHGRLPTRRACRLPALVLNKIRSRNIAYAKARGRGMRFEDFAAEHGLIVRHVEYGAWRRVPTVDHPAKKTAHTGTWESSRLSKSRDDERGCYVACGRVIRDDVKSRGRCSAACQSGRRS